MAKAVICEHMNMKTLRSNDYNFVFDKETGFFARWGQTEKDDPQFSPFGPEIADIEISTVCHGVPGVGVCKFCYKSNTPKGQNMSLDTFKKLFHKLPKTVTQIAFGIGDIDSNPDMWAIFDYAKFNGVTPNVTINGSGITREIADRLASTCGAVAISLYDEELTYNTIKMLTDRGMKQVNVHYMVSIQTADGAMQLLHDRLTDERLSKLNAIVFLGLKPKGRAKGHFDVLPIEKFKELVDFALTNKIGIGFDSCSQPRFIKSVENNIDYDKFVEISEACEATLFSSYFNTKGEYFPCSFIEGENVENGGDWTQGIDSTNCSDFIEDIWNNEKTVQFRQKCLSCRADKKACAHYNI